MWGGSAFGELSGVGVVEYGWAEGVQSIESVGIHKLRCLCGSVFGGPARIVC
jgi:hypothetical protein